MIRSLKEKTGLILMEALLAIAVLVVASLVMTTVFQTAVMSQALSRDYLIAQNLATEAIEVVKAVRNTNWLKYPTAPQCWLTRPELNCDPLDGEANAVEPKNYKFITDFNSSIKFDDINGELNLGDNTLDTTYELVIVDGLYRHVEAPENGSGFYRSIEFTQVSAVSATFEVKVQWMQGKKVYSIVRPVTIYNFESV